MTTANPAGRPGTSRQAVVEAALVLLEWMSLSPADLTAVPDNRLVEHVLGVFLGA